MRTEVQGCISPDHPALVGHFPGYPVVPGVVVLNEVLRAIEQHLPDIATVDRLALPSVKFTAPLRPGRPFLVRLESDAAGLISFTVTSGNTRIATGTLDRARSAGPHEEP